MINENTVRCFISLYETLSFTQTAKNLFMTQQAVSKNIAKLEEDLGTVLFYRNLHGVLPAEYAEEYYLLFCKLRKDLKNLSERVQNQKAGGSSLLRVGILQWQQIGSAPTQALNAMKEVYPWFTCTYERFSPMELKERFTERKVDMAITYERFIESLPGIHIKKLMDVQLALGVSISNPKIRPDSTWKDFIHETIIFDSLETGKANDVRERAREFVVRAGFHPKNIVIMYNRESAYTAAEQGNGVIFAPILSRIFSSPLLKRFPVDASESMVAVWMPDCPNLQAEAYAEKLSEELKKISQNDIEE